MTKIISVVNQKGGVAKTTSTHNIATALAMEHGKKVVMIDLDPQASLTISCGFVPEDDFEEDVSALFAAKPAATHDCIYETDIDGLYLIPSSMKLAIVELQLYGMFQRELYLKRAIEKIEDEFDYVLIDCPPQLSQLTVNALVASTDYIIPVKTDYLSYRGLEYLEQTVDMVRVTNPALNCLGVIATFFDGRTNDCKEILELLKDEYNVLGVTKKAVSVQSQVLNGKAIVTEKNNPVGLVYSDITKQLVEGVNENGK